MQEAERGLLCKVLCNLAIALWGKGEDRSRSLAFALAMTATILDENAHPFDREAKHPRKVRRVALECAQTVLRDKLGDIVDTWDDDWLGSSLCTETLRRWAVSYNWRGTWRLSALNSPARASFDEMLTKPGVTKTKVALMCKETGTSFFRDGQKDKAVMPYYLALYYLRGASTALCDLSRAHYKRMETAGDLHHVATVRTAVAATLLDLSEEDTRKYIKTLPPITPTATERDLYELQHAGAVAGSEMVKTYQEYLQASQMGKPGIEAVFDDRFPSLAEELAECRLSGLADAELQQLAEEIQAHCSLKFAEVSLAGTKPTGAFSKSIVESLPQWLPRNHLVKRFGGRPSEENMRLWQDKSVKNGTLFEKQPTAPYNVVHTFPNAPHDGLQYQAGSCHVAVGFVDLLPLVMGDFVGESDDPLRWVGYEASAHSVAKALVILEMLRACTSPRDVALVSYSSVWTHTGSAAFVAAVGQVLTTDSAPELSPDVVKYLEHWRGRSLTDDDARDEWFAFARRKLSASGSPIAAMKRRVDRQALFRYLVSGDLTSAIASEQSVGNVMMFALPPETASRQLFESAFSCFEDAVLPYHAERIQSDSRADVVGSLVSLLESRFEHLSGWIQDSRVQIEVHHNVISLDDTPNAGRYPCAPTVLDELVECGGLR